MCDHARMRINCRHEVGRENAARDVVRLRRVGSAAQKDLRAAIRTARAGGGDGVLYELARGYSDRGRAAARLAVGLGVVAVMFAAIAAFVAPSAANSIIGLALIPGAMLAVFTAWFSYIHDTGVRVDASGVLRVTGWGGVRELDLRSYARVTVADDPSDDVTWIEG